MERGAPTTHRGASRVQDGMQRITASRPPAFVRAALPRPLAYAVAFAAAFAVAFAVACSPSSGFRSLGRAPSTPYEQYAQSLRDAGLDETGMGREWLAASDSALRSPLMTRLPAREVGWYSRAEARAVAYEITVRRGQRLRATLRGDGQPARYFLDLFERSDDSTGGWVHRVSADSLAAPDTAAASLLLEFEASRDQQVVLRFQPELLRGGRYDLALRLEPTLAFPVEGRGNAAIQSYYGAARDGGRRDHHGIDIFAPRGTPVLAATDGVVRSTSPNGLGGNVVWLTDARRRYTLYYAHLDTQFVDGGQQVRAGDTLGLVGNTGNARTTPPHLHFGIYLPGRGPIDPLQYVRHVTSATPVLRADTAMLGVTANTRSAAVTLRASPHVRGDAIRRIGSETPLRIMGASAGWFRVQLDDGTAGYLTSVSLRVKSERIHDDPSRRQ